MKKVIHKDEWYPVYCLEDEESWGEKVDIPDSLWDKWVIVVKDFDECQGELKYFYNKAKLESSI